MAEKLKIIPLGGLDEIGKNCTVLEYGKDMIVVDCGVGFPDEDMYGVDLVIPDFMEMKLLYEGHFFHYLPRTKVLDEKIQKMDGFYNQRRRWLSAQYYSFAEFVNQLPSAIKEKKWGFIDKLYQQAAFSRVLLLGFIAIFTLVTTIFCSAISVKWWIILFVLLLSLGVAIPRRYWGWRLVRSMLLVPYSFVLMFINLFRLKEANKRFIHTEHGAKATE